MKPVPTQENIERLKNREGFVFDMDGTLILGNKDNASMNALPGAVEFLTLLNKKRIPYVIMTNGTVRSPKQYVGEIGASGVPLSEAIMMTPSSVAADYFLSRGYKRIMVLGCPGVWEPLVDAGLEVVLSSKPNPGHVDAVYIGWYREFTFTDLEAAWIAVRDGAPIYSASDVPFFATANGPGIGTSCAIAAAIESLTGKPAKVLGKPSQYAMQAAANRLGVPMDKIAVVGDDPQLEVPMALTGGAMGIFVYSGTGDENSYREHATEDQPDLEVDHLQELMNYYCG